MSFQSDLSAFGKKLEKSSAKTVRKITFQAYKMVTEKTPVRTGRAKNNWFVQGGSPSGEKTESKSGAPAGVAVSMARMLAEVSKISGKENTIYISNNLEYIAALENGSSLQAPAGMVAITVQELKHYIESGKLKI